MLIPTLARLVTNASALTPEQADAVACDLTCYCLRIPTVAYARSAPRDVVKEARSEMLRTYDATVRLKLVLYRLASERPALAKTIASRFVQWGLEEEDALIWACLERWGVMKPLRRLIRMHRITTENLPHPDTVPQMFHQWSRANDMQGFIGRYVYVSLRAFATANRLSVKDFEGDLWERATLCFYRAIPLYTPLYLRNHIRLSVKNRGKYLIAYYTAKSRSRLMAQDGGYTNRIRTIETGGENSVSAIDPEVEEMATLHGLPGGELSGNSEIRAMCISVKQLMDRYQSTGRVLRRRALELLTMHPDGEFVNYFNQVQRRRRSPVKSVADAFAACSSSEEYYSAVRTYLDMPPAAFDGLMQDLRSH